MKIIFALVRNGAVCIFLSAESSLSVDFSKGMETFASEFLRIEFKYSEIVV